MSQQFDLILFDDAVARDWYPFALTRPAGELLLGTLTLRERAERVLAAKCAGYISDQLLSGFDEGSAPHVLERLASSERPRVFLSSRCVLQWDVTLDYSEEATLMVGGQVAGWILPGGATPPSNDDFLAPAVKRGVERALGGKLLAHVWDLIEHNPDHIASDVLHFHPSDESAARPADTYLIGKHPLICGEAVSIEPGVVFDLSDGPVWLDDGVKVRAPARIAGPMYVGTDSVLLGGSYVGSSIGRMCKVHGEVEECVILGYSNKAHDGFMGHAYIGRWVNLGALTTNSDLKNNYSSVRIYTPAGVIDTGLTKLGSLIGDHVKTTIGAMLTTGTVIGPGANVLQGRPPKHVPPFHWGDVEYDVDKFLETAEEVMVRREHELSQSQRAMLMRVWQHTRKPAAE